MASGIDMDLENRVDRLESIDAIRQLASKYALTLDMRNLDQHVNLFVSDVSVGCLLYTSPSPRDQRGSRMPSSA